MLSLAFLLLAQQPPVAAPDSAVQNEIVVIGEKLKAFGFKLKTKKGSTVCTITKTTGDPQIDQIGCDAMTQCFSSLNSRIEMIQDRKTPKATRRSMETELNKDLTACVKETRSDKIAELVNIRMNSR
jgi:hypothetical protein